MDEHHTPETLIKFVFWLIWWNFSWYISLFIVYIYIYIYFGIVIISCIYLWYVHCSDFIYYVNKYHFSFAYFCCFISCMCIHIYVYTYIDYSFLYIVLFHLIFSFVIMNFFLKWLLCVFYYFDCFMYIWMNIYVGINMYLVSLLLVYMHSVYLDWQSLYKHAHMSTCSGGWNRYRWNRSG